MGDLHELRRLLQFAPVMVDGHALLPAAVGADVEVFAHAEETAVLLDHPEWRQPNPLLVQEVAARWADRFSTYRHPGPPDVAELNEHLPNRLAYVRHAIVAQAGAGAMLAQRFLSGGYDLGILLLIDGLSYFDCADWSEQPTPCFVDGPSITQYGFHQILQVSRLVQVLRDAGDLGLRAYSYWEADRNPLADQLFAGVPRERVRHFGEAFSGIATRPTERRFYFVLREGLDELAHRRREISPAERAASVAAIHADLRRLVSFARDTGLHALIGIIADHGLVWRDEESFRVVGSGNESWHGRYSDRPPSTPGVATSLGSGPRAYCYHPGLLCREPRANEAGFHGGLSARESFVPFALVEVN